MCDVQGSEEMTPKAILVGSKNGAPKLCVKCKTVQPNILIRNIRYCRTCFLYVFEGKFRSIMNRANATNDPSMKNILVGFSGGATSRAMLQLLHQYTASHNKYGQIKICYIDESLATGDNDFPLDDFYSIVKLYPFELITRRIEEPMGSKEEFTSALNGLVTLSAREDFLASLRHSLLVHTARESQCSMLLLGDSATRIAIKTISLTSKGRGFSLPFEVAAEASCYEGLAIIRPMRDSLSKEIVFYNHYMQLQYPTIKSILYNTKPKASINRITEEFIVGLDSGFPSTVSTVVRTANKLTPSANLVSGVWCPLCLNPAETNISSWLESIAVRSLANSSAQPRPLDVAAELLCYGCRTSWEESKGISLPLYANSYSEQQRSKRELLKAQIDDFLIE